MPDAVPPKPFGEFDFDLARAVLEQLVEAFDVMPVGRLESSELMQLPPTGQGVYQLYLDQELRYVGKADRLRHRLLRHLKLMSSRKNLDPARIGFKGLFIHRNWTTWATEDAMIRYFSPNHPDLWNMSGFGSNDPGHNREDTAETDTFNNEYPIDPDITFEWLTAQTGKAWDILSDMKDKLPYLLRFHKVTDKFKRPIDHEAQSQLKKTDVIISADGMTVRDVLISITQQLGEGWQATQFKGRLIVYKERVDYNHGEILHRS